MSGITIFILISIVIFLSFSIPYFCIQGRKESYYCFEENTHNGPDVIGLPMIFLVILIILNFVFYEKLDNSENFVYEEYEINAQNYEEELNFKLLELKSYQKYKTTEKRNPDGTIELEKVKISNEPIFLSVRFNQYYIYTISDNGRLPEYLDFDEPLKYNHKGLNNLYFKISENDQLKVESKIKRFDNKFVRWYYGDKAEKIITFYIPEKNVVR